MMGSMERARMLWLAVGVAVLALAVRLPGLGEFMTVDEENWMLRSAGFWHQFFRNAHPSGTFMTTHPGAPAMWLIGAGIFWQEARLGFDIDTSNLRHFRLAATLPLASAVAVLIGVIAGLLLKLFGTWPGGMAGVVLALDPYLAGMSQIAHLDALLALYMLIAVLVIFLYRREKWRGWLVAAGIFTGLALATKFLPALWLLVVFCTVLTACQYRWPGKHPVFLRQHRVLRRPAVLEVVRNLGFVGGLALLVMYLVWPALWVKDDLWRSFERDAVSVVSDEHVALSVGNEGIEPRSFYGRTLLSRTTPFVLLLTAGTLVIVIRFLKERRRLLTVGWLLLYAAGFLVLMTLAAKKADRYALPALVVLPVVAGWAFGTAVGAWRERRQRGFSLSSPPSLVASGVVVLLLAQTWLWYPYPIAYNNPYFDVRPASQQGWGEGLDRAAQWLNAHPLADVLTVASWYPGVLGTYFNGQTMSLSSRDDHRVGFVVLYRNMQGRAPDTIASDVLDEFRERQPEHIVYIQGEPYAYVYNTLGPRYFRQHVGELTGGVEVGQWLPVSVDSWSAIDVALATFSSRLNTEDVILHVRDSIDAADDLRTVTVNASQLQDEAWQRFDFEPILGARGQTFYVALTSPAAVPGNAITVRFTPQDVLPGQLVLKRRALRAGERMSDFVRAGDMAYRIPSL
ncbi:MAG: phospholipid carrier-dependent glycosyltransferase [Candidatus Andersenbacteria bacterium]|nr:phospholipid carrier-dependent glycosyltransferase [Candidatus Andersenbacteria bacterium]